MPRGMQIRGKTVLVTGATGGIGQAIARTLASHGATLVLTGRRVDVLAPLAKELGATAIAANLADASDVERLLDEAGHIDILVANAGLSASGRILDFTVANLDSALSVNLRAPMVMARLLGERMAANGSGHIVFIGSVSGKVASGGGGLYSATKFGLRGFSFGLREDLRSAGVGVSIVEPGFIRDAGMFADAGAPTPPGVRTSSPDQVANGVVRAITKNVGEIVIAPLEMRFSVALGVAAPGIAAWIQRKAGGDKVAQQLSEVHRHKL